MSIDQLVELAHASEKYKTEKITTDGSGLHLWERSILEDDLPNSVLLKHKDKSTDISSETLTPKAFIDDVQQVIHFGLSIEQIAQSLLSRVLASPTLLTTTTDAATERTLAEMDAELRKNGWKEGSPIHIENDALEITVGPNGEKYMYDKLTHIETIQTTSSDGTTTVVTKQTDGDKTSISGFTSEYSYTTSGEDGSRILTITTKGDPPVSIILKERGNGFEVLDPTCDDSNPDTSDGRNRAVISHLDLNSDEDIKKFNLLMQHLISMHLQPGESYSVQDLFQNYASMSYSALLNQFDAATRLDESIMLTLGTLGSPNGTGPTAQLSADGEVPVIYDFGSGDVSIGATDGVPDFIFHVHGKTTGVAIGLARLHLLPEPRSRGEVDEAQTIATIVDAAIAIAQLFRSSPSMDPGVAIAQLGDLFSQLGAIPNSVQAVLAQATVTDAIGGIIIALAKLEQNAPYNNSNNRTDVMNGTISTSLIA